MKEREKERRGGGMDRRKEGERKGRWALGKTVTFWAVC